MSNKTKVSVNIFCSPLIFKRVLIGEHLHDDTRYFWGFLTYLLVWWWVPAGSFKLRPSRAMKVLSQAKPSWRTSIFELKPSWQNFKVLIKNYNQIPIYASIMIRRVNLCLWLQYIRQQPYFYGSWPELYFDVKKDCLFWIEKWNMSSY